MLRVAQGAPSRGERSNCGAERVDTYTIRACSPRMSNLKHQSRMHSAPNGRARGVKKCIGRVSPASGQAQKSQPMVVCESAPEGGGRADTLFAGKAERTAKIAIETNQKPCMLQMSESLACWPLQETRTSKRRRCQNHRVISRI